MTNLTSINDKNPSNIVFLIFDESELSGMYQSDEYDYSPNDLVVEFDFNLIDKAKKLFKIDPDLFSVNYRADIISTDYEGKIEADLVQIYIRDDQPLIYACFSNGYSGTYHELDITDKVLEALQKS